VLIFDYEFEKLSVRSLSNLAQRVRASRKCRLLIDCAKLISSKNVFSHGLFAVTRFLSLLTLPILVR